MTAPTFHDNGDFSGWKIDNQPWAQEVALALSHIDGVDNHSMYLALEHLREVTNDSHIPARQLLGEPEQVARTAFNDLAAIGSTNPEATIAEQRTHSTPSIVGFSLLISTVLTLILTVPFTADWYVRSADNLLFVWSMSVLMLLAGALPYNYVRRGMFRRAALSCLGALAGLVLLGVTLGTWAFTDGNDVPVHTMPLLCTEIVVVVLGGYLVFGKPFLYTSPDTRDWFTQYEGLLRGQHFLTRKEARAYVAEARAHLTEIQQETGNAPDPRQEFGDAGGYAEKMVGNTALSKTRRTQGMYVAYAVQLLASIWIFYSFAARHSSQGWAVVLAVVLSVLNIGWFIAKIRGANTKLKQAFTKEGDEF